MSLDDSDPGPEHVGETASYLSEMRDVSDARTLRALTHPVRIALIEALSLGGAMTATQLGEQIGESPTTCSFHLRQGPAKYGYVEEAGGGKGRARPWKMTSIGMNIRGIGDPETEIAAAALDRLVTERQIARFQAWTRAMPSYLRDWRKAAGNSEWVLFLTPDELKQLNDELGLCSVLNLERLTEPSKRPPGSLPVDRLCLYPIAVPGAAPGGDPASGEPPTDRHRVGTAVMTQMFGATGGLLMAAAILVSTFGCVNGLILSGARVYYAMAKDRLFFRSVANLHPSYKTPAASLIVQMVWTCLLCISGSYGQLLDYIIFAALLFYILTIAGLFVLRRTRPDAERPYRAFGYPVVPAVYIVMALFIDVVLLRYKPQFTWPGLIVVVLGIPVYYAWRGAGAKRAAS